MHVRVQDRSLGVILFHVSRLANCESEKAVTPQEGWTVRTSRGPRRRQKMGLDLEDLEGTARTPEEEYEEQIICVSEA